MENKVVFFILSFPSLNTSIRAIRHKAVSCFLILLYVPNSFQLLEFTRDLPVSKLSLSDKK